MRKDVVHRCAVLGDPIAHSLSPALHRAAYVANGLAWTYDAYRVGVAQLPGWVAGLDASWRGLSVTMPLKRAALELAPRASPRARMAAAANTLLLEGGRVVAADNTDIPGAVRALRERYDGPVHAATVLGGGATATSALLALADLGCRDVVLQVRDEARAAETLAAATRRAEETGERLTVRLERLGAPAFGEVVVSTVPAAAQTGPVVAACTTAEVIFDAVYDPWPTPLAVAAQAAGRVFVSGLDLLVHQAALQFEQFTGLFVPVVPVMRSAGEAALARRGHEEHPAWT